MAATQRRAVRHQAGRPARQGHEREGARAAARRRRARPDRARARRHHRHRHLRHHRRGDRDPGPAIVLAFVLAGITCVFSALSFAELASSIPVSGTAYTYCYATLGELVAWIIGWDLLLEYGVSIAAVAVGWGQYFNELLDSVFGTSLPDSSRTRPARAATVNLPAAFLVVAVGRAHGRRARDRAHEHDDGLVQARRAGAVHRARRHRVHPRQLLSVLRRGQGFSGTVTAAALIFFAYIGFDAVSTASEEAKSPSATCRSGSSARWRSRRSSTSPSRSSPPGRCRSTSSAAPRRRWRRR